MSSETIKALAAITDEGLFEQLALAVLHCAEPLSACLSQQGINAAGKTKASPVDNVGFVRSGSPPHMIVVHHTIAAAADLRAKWLGGSSSRAKRKAPQREGDIEKTARIVQEQREQQPNLKATLFLTTNQEPDQKLVREVAAVSETLNIEIDIWSRVRLARVLDTDATGQWIRASLLDIDQQWLSADLLAQLSSESIDDNVRPDAAKQWVARGLDRQLAASHRAATFIVGASGAGKSVAGLRALSAQLDAGGYAVVLPHRILENAPSLNAALLATLQQFRPALTGHIAPLSVPSPERPLLLLVEDINHAGNPTVLIDKITRWSADAGKDGNTGRWRILCPMWQRTLNGVPDALRRSVETMALYPEALTSGEASAALKIKAVSAGTPLSDINAHEIAAELGFDPLLIGLYELGTGSEPPDVIATFIEHSLLRCEARSGLPASELRSGLKALGEKMLERGVVAPSWPDLAAWDLSAANLDCLRQIAAHGELLRLSGPSHNQGLGFRHDRVRDNLLAESAAAMFDEGRLSDALIADPYFSEVMARLLIARLPVPGFARRVQSANPTALFHALRLALLRSSDAAELEELAAAWLVDPINRSCDSLNLRYNIAGILLECDGAAIPRLARMLPESTRHSRLARLRNGDLEAGIEDCLARNFYSRDVWRKRQIDHAKPRHSDAMMLILGERLRDPATPDNVRSALLNIAGDFAEPALATAIEASRQLDADQASRLDDYLWALSNCCTGETAASLLSPICDDWAALSTERRDNGMSSPRDSLIGDSMRWAFERNPPAAAISYFAVRGRNEDLNWPIYYMMHGIDQPEALAFSVDTMAAGRARNIDYYFVNFRQGADVWERRRDEHGEYMSAVGRALLRGWWQDVGENEHRRVAAFDLWAASWAEDDLQHLRVFEADGVLSDRILRKRLERGDATALPALIEKLDGDRSSYWWFFTRHVPPLAVASAIEQALGRIAADDDARPDSNIGWELASALIRLPTATAESILLKHQHTLSRSARFIQCALYLATPDTLAFAERSISAAAEPGKMLELITSHFGIDQRDHQGVTRPQQIRALVPYLHLLDRHDLDRLAAVCNKAGWFDLRRELFDPLIPESRDCWTMSRLPALFDKLVSDRPFISHQLDEVVEAGLTWHEIVNALGGWLSQRDDEGARRLAGKILEDRGYRRDLQLLENWAGLASDASRATIANATFSVRLRSAQA